MKLELHPNAVNNFNEKADKLIDELSSYTEKSLLNKETSFRPDYYVSGSFSEDIIIEKQGLTNLLGKQSASALETK